jgi:outer membrane protein assembly factor BamB
VVDTRTSRRVIIVLSFFLCVAPGFMAGCGTTTHTSSVFNAPAPLPADITIPYAVGGSNPPATPGLTGLRARDGAFVWHAATGEPGSQDPPVEVNGVIYAEGDSVPGPQGSVDQTGAVAAVRATDGRILWQAPLPTGAGTGDRDFRIATDGMTVLVSDPTAGLYALAAATGAVRWRLDEPATWPLAVRDGVAVATLPDSQGDTTHVVVYQEDNGQMLWQGEDFSSGNRDDIGTIGINHTAVYLTGQTGLTAYAARTGRQLWCQNMAGGIVGVDDHTLTLGILGGVHSVACLDAATGSVIWSADGPFEGWNSMIRSPTALYVTDTDGQHQHLIALSMANGAKLWQVEFPGYRIDSITQEQGIVFVKLFQPPNMFGPNVPDRLAALDGARGTVCWERDQDMYSLVNMQQ